MVQPPVQIVPSPAERTDLEPQSIHSMISGAMSRRKWKNSSDTDLIGACLAGEGRAWDALIERYSALIYTIALRMGLSRPDADDLFQEVCVILLQHLGDLRNREQIASWLISTTKREGWRMSRKNKTVTAADLSNESWLLEESQFLLSGISTSPEEDVIALEEQHQVWQAVIQMSEPCQTLLVLLFYEDPPCPYQELAARMQISLGSIGPTRARCLQRLAKILKKMDF